MRLVLNDGIILSLGPDFFGGGGGGDSFVPTYIPAGQNFTVPVNKQAYAPYAIRGDGELVVHGKLKLGAP